MHDTNPSTFIMHHISNSLSLDPQTTLPAGLHIPPQISPGRTNARTSLPTTSPLRQHPTPSFVSLSSPSPLLAHHPLFLFPILPSPLLSVRLLYLHLIPFSTNSSHPSFTYNYLGTDLVSAQSSTFSLTSSPSSASTPRSPLPKTTKEKEEYETHLTAPERNQRDFNWRKCLVSLWRRGLRVVVGKEGRSGEEVCGGTRKGGRRRGGREVGEEEGREVDGDAKRAGLSRRRDPSVVGGCVHEKLRDIRRTDPPLNTAHLPEAVQMQHKSVDQRDRLRTATASLRNDCAKSLASSS
ncbi:hypothetical protein R3P38DRAFT_3279940 [Favolaschia claudopus]|uniref:Uncharacterized protein n=1 Tax=Favolaschia claudopus TaxID=2862362 RepID=A0AAW0AI63_9AGAR